MVEREETSSWFMQESLTRELIDLSAARRAEFIDTINAVESYTKSLIR